MAYVNSGITMKNTHYDWKIIIAIVVFLIGVTALVAIKVVYPEFEPEKLLSTTPTSTPAHHLAEAKALQTVPVMPAKKSESSQKVTSQPDSTSPVKPKPLADDVIKPTEIKSLSATIPSSVQTAEKASKIVCSVEDREAQFCQ